MLGKGKKQKDCYHVNVRKIYGDEIIAAGWNLPTLPPKDRNG
jgi:hypothetical protein